MEMTESHCRVVIPMCFRAHLTSNSLTPSMQPRASVILAAKEDPSVGVSLKRSQTQLNAEKKKNTRTNEFKEMINRVATMIPQLSCLLRRSYTYNLPHVLCLMLHAHAFLAFLYLLPCP